MENPILEQQADPSAEEQLSMPLGGSLVQQKEAAQGQEQQDAGAPRKRTAPGQKPAGEQMDMQVPEEPIPREVLELLLAAGPADYAGLWHIYFLYQTEPDRKKRAAFLQQTYGQGGMGFTISGRDYALWHDREGLTFCRGRSARYEPGSLHLSWEEAEKQIETLVLQGRYLQAEDRDQVRETVLSHTATKLCYLARNLREDAIREGILSCITDLGTDFPQWEELVQSLLADAKALFVVTEELERLAASYKADPELLRLHTQNPKELLRMLRLLAKEPQEYPLSDAYQKLAPAFITEDEVDAVLMRGGTYTDSQWDTYVYFRRCESPLERQKYLREQFGTGGQSSTNYSWDYRSKGVSLTRSYDGRDYDTVHRTWIAAEKRVTELIQRKQYLQGASQEEYAAYSRRALARRVFRLLHVLLSAGQSGKPEAARWEELVPILEQAKPAGELHLKILDAFPYLPRDTKDYEFCAHVLEDLTEYVNGSYGLLADFPAVTPQDWEPELDAQQIRAALEEAMQLEAEEAPEHPQTPETGTPEEAAESEAATRPAQQAEEQPEEREPAKALEPTPEGEQGEPQTEEPQQPAASEPAEKKQKEAPEVPAKPAAEPEEQPQNFHMTKDPPVRTPKETLQGNLKAIQVLKALEAEERTASEPEQEVLSRYVGWGGLSQALDETGPWKEERSQLQALLTKEEYESAKGSTLNAHYTPPVLIRAMYRAVQQMGFQRGNLLEPSCGVGRFFGLLPDSMAESRLYGVELDSLSGRMAQKLYPGANIRVQGFEETDFPDQFFDLVIGNVPFGSYSVVDPGYERHLLRIHDYFIAKSLNKLRPGGLAALITTKGTLDKANSKTRAYFAERADLAGAIRLPTAAFRSAGTSVTCDILFFQKREPQQSRDADWLHVDPGEDGIPINRYFQQHPEMLLGTMQEISGPFGTEYACILEDEAALESRLENAIASLQPDILKEPLPEEPEEGLEPGEMPEELLPASPEVRNFSYALVGETLYYRENSRMRRCQAEGAMRERILGMMDLRDAARQVLTLQLADGTDEEIRQAQQELEQRYDAYTGKYGLLNSRGNKLAFQEDDSYPLLCSLEELDEDGGLRRKADLFYKRTIARSEVITHTDTAADALAVSLSERAGVDLELMETLCGRSREALLAELKGVIFCDPVSGSYVTADAYLSGNVRQKLEQAQAAAEEDAAWQEHVEALKAVQPKPLTAAEIEVRLGATWLHPSYITAFMKEVFQTPQVHLAQETIAVSYSPHTGNWNISGKSADRSVYATVTYGTRRASAYRLLEDSLNLRNVQIFDTALDEEGREKRVLNKKETVLASQKQEQIRQAFSDWIWKEPERRSQLCDTYNRRFNAYVPRTFSGDHLKFPGMNPEIVLRPHQKDAVARQLYGGNTLLAHCVGAGKTFTMAAAAMESKRIGLSRKAMFVVPNHLTTQWAAEFLRLYPAAKVLAAAKQDFTPGNRKKFCSRIAAGDYDAVIIGHSQFERIPLSKERQSQFLEDQIETITFELEEARERDGQGAFTVKQMAQQKKQLEQRLKRLHDDSSKDTVVTFEELGIDRLFVDEAHTYKNLQLQTKMRNVAGITTAAALKSSDLFAKCRYMDEKTGGKGIIFATGTPISNSVAEMYTMQRYLQYEGLKERQLLLFDSWASTFGETVTALELAPEGNGYRAKTRFARFYNLPELQAMFREFADVQTADMLKLPVPKAVYENVVLQPSPQQKHMVEELGKRAELVRGGSLDPTQDNMLRITTDGRKLALDERLIDESLPGETSKAQACAERIFSIWEETREQKGTQLIFCDQSTPKGDGHFHVYGEIKRLLVQQGVPEQEVRFIHEAATDAAKTELFRKVRTGEVRVLLGSTAKMGAGTNVQTKLVALHHTDVPWKPSDIEQQEGRILRQGNENKEVRIFRYVTEQTFDAYSWQLIENKQKFISQIMTSKLPSRSCEDVDEAALSYAEVKALATGNPYMKEKLDLDVQVSRLMLLKANHQNQIYQLEDAIAKRYPAKCARLQEELTQVEADITRYQENRSEVFQMELQENRYTERKEAGSKLMELCKGVKQQGKADASPIGRYSGFELLLKSDSWFSDKYLLTLQGVHTHTLELGADGLGNITRIQNFLEKLPERLAKMQEALRQTRGEWEQAKEECKKPFAQEAELQEKTARLAELNVLLDVGETKCKPAEQPKFQGAVQEDHSAAPAAEPIEPVQSQDMAALER